MADYQTQYNLSNLTQAKKYFDEIYNDSNQSGHAKSAKANYDNFLVGLSAKRVCCKESPNRLNQSTWNTYEGTIYDDLATIVDNSQGASILFSQIYSEISAATSDSSMVDPNTNLMASNITLTVAGDYSADGDSDDGGLFDWLLGAFKTLVDFIADVIATFVDACVSLLLGLCQLVEGIIDAVAMLIGGGLALIGVVDMSSVTEFVAKDWTNDVIGDWVYNQTFVGSWILENSWLDDNARGFFQETGRWVGIAALSCILPGSGAIIGGVLGGTSGFGIGAEESLQAGGSYTDALMYGTFRGVIDGLIGRNLGANFNGGLSWGEYVNTVKSDGFIEATKNALIQGGKDFASIIFPTYPSPLLAPSGALAKVGAYATNFSYGILFPAAFAAGKHEIVDFITRTPNDVNYESGVAAPSDTVPSDTSYDSTVPQTPSDSQNVSNPTKSTNPTGGYPNSGYQGTSSGNQPVTPDEQPIYNETPSDPGTGSEPGNNPGNNLEEPGNGGTPGDNEPGNNVEDPGNGGTPGDNEPGNNVEDPGNGGTPGDNEPGNNPGEPGNGGTPGDNNPGDNPGEPGDENPSGPNVSVENVGPESIPLQDAGALGAIGMGAAVGGYTGGGYTSAPGTIAGGQPEYSTAPGNTDNNDDNDDSNKNKNKYIFESMPPTVENPALDAGLLDTPQAEVTLDGIEPTTNVATETAGVNTTTELNTEQSNNSDNSNVSLDADKTNLNTVLGLGGISAGLGVGGVYISQAKKDSEKEEKVKEASHNLGVAGGMMGATLLDENIKKDNNDQQGFGNNGFNQ